MGPSPSPTFPKGMGCKSATTDWAHHVGSSSGLITIVVVILFIITSTDVAHFDKIWCKVSDINLAKTIILITKIAPGCLTFSLCVLIKLTRLSPLGDWAARWPRIFCLICFHSFWALAKNVRFSWHHFTTSQCILKCAVLTLLSTSSQLAEIS